MLGIPKSNADISQNRRIENDAQSTQSGINNGCLQPSRMQISTNQFQLCHSSWQYMRNLAALQWPSDVPRSNHHFEGQALEYDTPNPPPTLTPSDTPPDDNSLSLTLLPMSLYRNYNQPGKVAGVRVFTLNALDHQEGNYSEWLKTACLLAARPPLKPPVSCPRCLQAAVFDSRICYKYGIAGAWNMVVSNPTYLRSPPRRLVVSFCSAARASRCTSQIKKGLAKQIFRLSKRFETRKLKLVSRARKSSLLRKPRRNSPRRRNPPRARRYASQWLQFLAAMGLRPGTLVVPPHL